MKLLQIFTSKPWLEANDSAVVYADKKPLDVAAPPSGLRVLFLPITALFLLFVVSYRMRMHYEDWQAMQDPWQLWLNTGLLIAASVCLQWARMAAARQQWPAIRFGLYAGGFFTFAFIAGQLWAWQALAEAGYFVTTNPAHTFFYLITAVHGLHVLGGLVAWLRAVVKLRHGAPIERLHISIRLCSVYWHYLMIVWFVLFYLLLTT